MSDDQLLFAEEGPPDEALAVDGYVWKVLIVDDQDSIHAVTRMVLDDFTFEGRRVECLSAYSGEEACELVGKHPEIAVILLDVVMETTSAGVDAARYIREELRNSLVRIILRTGQPGEAPEHEVVTALDINDYRHKTELTSHRLMTAVTMAIRSYRDIKAAEDARQGLHLLAMSVAHQVRNRTVAIAGFANIIRKKAAGSADLDEHLCTILDESTRLETMVSDVTRYASIKLGEVRQTSIRDILDAAMAQVEETTDSGRRGRWQVVCPDQVIPVDAALCIQAFAAILQNGVDFSGGEEPLVIVSVKPGPLTCTVTIQDSGFGIDDQHMPFIFDPFFSVKPEGSGMGLAIVRRVAMEHQWDVHVNSELGKGTVVHVVIPRKELTGLH